MKLSNDLIRDTLLFAESLKYNQTASNSQIAESDYGKKYSQDEILYAISRLGDNDAKLIKGSIQYASNNPFRWFIGSPTYAGHQYLENIRDPKIWKETKEKMALVGSASLSILSQVAASIIQNKLGI